MANWNEWRDRAHRRLPKMIFDYIDGGADDEVTRARNRLAFDDIAFASRVLAGVGERSQRVSVLGQELAIPVITAPTGLSRSAGIDGEIAAARAASATGTVSILSGSSSVPLAEVAASVTESQWFQLYLYNDRAMTERRLQEARDGRFRVLVVTADAAVSGNRERDGRNGLSIPVRVRPSMVTSVALRPHWLYSYLVGPPMAHADTAPKQSRLRRIIPGADASLASVVQGLFNADQTWEDLRRLRAEWDGPLVLKGIMTAEDARRAVDLGCEGVVVSNHGGRQLDGLPASIEMLPEVVDAVGDRCDVLLDSGVRRGTDVVKALALGAKACLIGRPWLFGLASGGEAGVRQVLEEFASEIDRTLALVGVPEARALERSVLRRRPGSGWERYPENVPK